MVTAESRKRPREVSEADSVAPRKIKAVDELRSMTVKQLREESGMRGVSIAGTKKELIERLCGDEHSVSGEEGN